MLILYSFISDVVVRRWWSPHGDFYKGFVRRVLEREEGEGENLMEREILWLILKQMDTKVQTSDLGIGSTPPLKKCSLVLI